MLNLFDIENESKTEGVEPCIICLESLQSKEIHKLQKCNHEFHSSCLLQWFQSGNLSCPYCRDNGINNDGNHINYFQPNETIFQLKLKYASRKNAPRDFKKIVQKYETLKSKLKEIEKNNKEYRQEIKNLDENLSYNKYTEEKSRLMKLKRKNSLQLFKIRSKFYDVRNAIISVPIQPMIIPLKKYRKIN